LISNEDDEEIGVDITGKPNGYGGPEYYYHIGSLDFHTQIKFDFDKDS